MHIYLSDKSGAFSRLKQSTINAAGGAFCAPHFSTRLDFTPKVSLSLSFSSSRWTRSPSLSTKTGPRHLFRPFTFDPSLFVFPGPPSSRALPSAFGRDLSLPSRPPLRFLSSSPLPFLRATPGFPVHRCHLSPSSPATFFVRAISLDPPPHRFFSFLTPGLGP